MQTTWRTLAALSVLLAWAGGCQPTVGKDKFDRLNQKWLDCLRENRDLTRRNQTLEETLGRQNRQITTLQNLGDKRLENLYVVTYLELGRRSGGIDTDGQDGDDAVVVYLRPIDQYGHVIKAAGEATVQLYDLAAPPEQNLIGEYHWSVEELGATWAGGFLGSSQFSLRCPWRSGPPAHEKITLHVTFTDYLTGKTFSDQTVVTVHLPGELERRGKLAAPRRPRGKPEVVKPAEVESEPPPEVPATQPAASAPTSQPASAPGEGLAD